MMAAISKDTSAMKEAISFSANRQRFMRVTPLLVCPIFYHLLAFHHSRLNQFVEYVCTDEYKLSSNEVLCDHFVIFTGIHA